jgi:hypothetical protein
LEWIIVVLCVRAFHGLEPTMRGFAKVKKALPMSDAAYLDQATMWSKELTRMKARGPGDTENAMRRIEREYGIDYGFLWSLRYRRERLRIISISVYESIRAAYRAECERQMRKLTNEIARTEQVAGPNSHSVRSAKALLNAHLRGDP